MARLLLYCTQSKPYLHRLNDDEFELTKKLYSQEYYDEYSDCTKDYSCLNGKIVAECECDLVERIFLDMIESDYYIAYELRTRTYDSGDLSTCACLEYEDLEKYFKVKRGENADRCDIYSYHKGYAMVLEEDSVNIFDESKELTDYGLTKAPQNMCYVYDKHSKEWCILLSIRSKPLCQILNGEKTIEVRRMILNALKELIR